MESHEKISEGREDRSKIAMMLTADMHDMELGHGVDTAFFQLGVPCALMCLACPCVDFRTSGGGALQQGPESPWRVSASCRAHGLNS